MLAHIDPEGRKREIEVTPGPGQYDEKFALSSQRILLGNINPESLRFQRDQETPGPATYNPRVDGLGFGISSSKRVVLGHINPVGRYREIEVTVGPGEY